MKLRSSRDYLERLIISVRENNPNVVQEQALLILRELGFQEHEIVCMKLGIYNQTFAVTNDRIYQMFFQQMVKAGIIQIEEVECEEGDPDCIVG